jgi:hypothetical protein
VGAALDQPLLLRLADDEGGVGGLAAHACGVHCADVVSGRVRRDGHGAARRPADA